MTNVLICSYLEPELVERVRSVDASLEVVYRPDLLPQPRYGADHVGAPLVRSAADQATWDSLLARAEVLFDFDYTDISGLATKATNARWLQASSAGIGQLVERRGLARTGITFTTASGVHARPLAEFVMMVMLEHVKRAALAREQQRERLWQRFSTGELSGKTLGIVGFGRIGKEVARLARAFDMRIIASKRTTAGHEPADLGVDALFDGSGLHQLLAESDYVCLITPHTPETEGLMDEAAFAAVKPGAVLINIARGVVVDEPALLNALDSGRLAHAALDVAAVEPLPADSPLWDHPEITIYPHSASTGEYENERLVELFCDNLRRYLAGEPLRNELDTARLY